MSRLTAENPTIEISALAKLVLGRALSAASTMSSTWSIASSPNGLYAVCTRYRTV